MVRRAIVNLCKTMHVKFRRTVRLLSVLSGILCLPGTQDLLSHECPPGAFRTGKRTVVTVLVRQPDGTFLTLQGRPVGVCDRIRLRYELGYVAGNPSGSVGAFQGGQIYIATVSGSFSNNVTPPGGVPLIGPTDTLCPGGTAPAVSEIIVTNTVDFDISTHQADIVDGKINFVVQYGPLGTIVHLNPHLVDDFAAIDPHAVSVNPPPTCTIIPRSTDICVGGNATFTASVTNGNTNVPPYIFRWTGPNGFTSGPRTNFLGNTDQITITNAQTNDRGTYTATVQVTSSNAANSPASFIVTLTVT